MSLINSTALESPKVDLRNQRSYSLFLSFFACPKKRNKRKRGLKNDFLSSYFRNGLLFTSVVKQANAAAREVEPASDECNERNAQAQRFAIRTIRRLRSFQGCKNKPRFFWFLFSSMEKRNKNMN